MEPALPTREQIEELLSFLPLVREETLGLSQSREKPSSMEKRSKRGRNAERLDLSQLLHVLRQSWMDPSYDPSREGSLLDEEGGVERADMVQLRRLFTFFVRGERFCEGFWDGMVQSGELERLLVRLETLHDGSMSKGVPGKVEGLHRLSDEG